jgi:uncharacterized membrane protein YecN with MAPEG domain
MPNVTADNAAAFWVALHLLLLLVLSALVVRLRQKHKVALGDEGIPELAQAIRAFGNATEYVPAGLAALIVLSMVEARPLPVHVVGLTLFVGRVTHAIGLSTSGNASIARAAGIMLTWLAYVFAIAALLFYAIV